MKKAKFLAALFSAAITASVSVLGVSAAHYRGDITRDDDVNTADIVSIQKYLIGEETLDKDVMIYADANGDGKFNIFDLMVMKKTALGQLPKVEIPEFTTPPETTTTTTTTIITTTTTITTVNPVETTIATTVKPEETTVTETVNPVETTIATTVKPVETTTVSVTEESKETITVKLDASKTEEIKLDSTKEIDYIEFEVDMMDNSKIHMYIDNWSMWANISKINGTLVYNETDNKMIDSVTIDGNKVKIDISDGIIGNTLYIKNDAGSEIINLTITNIAMAGDSTITPEVTTAKPVETTIATTTKATETTVVTTTKPDETTAKPVETAVVTTAKPTEETTTVLETKPEESVTTTLILDTNKSIDVVSAKELDTFTISIDTETDYYSLNLQFGDWIAWLDITCANGTLTTNFTGSNGAIDDVTIDGNTVKIKFKENTNVNKLTFNNNGKTITVTDYKLTYAVDTEQ